MSSMEWHAAAKRYLERLGLAEWRVFLDSKPRKRERYSPSPYHVALIGCLNRNDEHAFKQMKMLEGYASAVGV